MVYAKDFLNKSRAWSSSPLSRWQSPIIKRIRAISCLLVEFSLNMKACSAYVKALLKSPVLRYLKLFKQSKIACLLSDSFDGFPVIFSIFSLI